MMDLTLHRATLERRRTLAGYSVPGLARQLGISAGHMYRIEWGKKRPSPALYTRIKDALGVTDESLLAAEHAPAGDGAEVA